MQRESEVMAWLDAGVPLTLVLDLFATTGPDSQRLLADERPDAAQLEWLAAVAG